MDSHERMNGKPDPNASPELSRFAFLIGKWRFDVKLKGEDGAWGDLKATWEGHYILDHSLSLAMDSRTTRNPPASQCDERPYAFDQTKRPRPLKEAISRGQKARARKRQDEPSAAVFERVTHQHCRDGR